MSSATGPFRVLDEQGRETPEGVEPPICLSLRVCGPGSDHLYDASYGEDWKQQALDECRWRNQSFAAGRAAEREAMQGAVDGLRNALDRDKTGLAAALAAIVREVNGRAWIQDGRGSYEWDDDRYKQEAYWAFGAVKKIAVEALRASGNLAHAALDARSTGAHDDKGGTDGAV